jgi:hypothetical protein
MEANINGESSRARHTQDKLFIGTLSNAHS